MLSSRKELIAKVLNLLSVQRDYRSWHFSVFSFNVWTFREVFKLTFCAWAFVNSALASLSRSRLVFITSYACAVAQCSVKDVFTFQWTRVIFVHPSIHQTKIPFTDQHEIFAQIVETVRSQNLPKNSWNQFTWEVPQKGDTRLIATFLYISYLAFFLVGLRGPTDQIAGPICMHVGSNDAVWPRKVHSRVALPPNFM